ncbi:MAG: hypothetical protein B7Z73_17905 [Planctomycetia bacterium 21-64-5]|nr:MAG: hypothetical protein B7Z73_17905 [Planctomycetia bacterium 21-64-5]
MLLRFVSSVTLRCLLEGQRIGLAKTIGGAPILATGVQDVRQPEQQIRAALLPQTGLRQPGFERGQIGVGQFAAQQRGQPRVRPRQQRL